jgi:transglutaminase-like putative cysteine protease
MKYSVGCTLEYAVPSPSVFVFNVTPALMPMQRIEYEAFTVEPDMYVEVFIEPTTGTRYHRVNVSGPQLSVRYHATVTTSPDVVDPAELPGHSPADLPLADFPYVVPSRYCQSDLLMRLAYREFGRLPFGFARPAAISDWIHHNVDYLVGTTTPLTSAFDTATSRAGVCRDFAHLGIAFCRALNIPARFVSAYAYDLWPRDFHAVFEAKLGDRWYLFDPTHQASTGGLVRIGVGRDAADVSFASIFGPARMTHMDVYADAADAESERTPKEWKEWAVSGA